MREIEYDYSPEEMLQKIESAIKITKQFKNAMKQSLLKIKHDFDYLSFMKAYFNNSKFDDIAKKLNCSLIFKIGKKTVTLKSNIDSNVRASIKLLSENEYFEYLKKCQEVQNVNH